MRNNFVISCCCWVLFSFLFPVTVYCSVQGRVPKGAVVLVPGTANSLVPGSIERDRDDNTEITPYFSSAILKAIRNQGYEIYIVRGLSPFGQFEVNGETVLREMTEWYKDTFRAKDRVPITMIGHSAGGFYSMYAISQRQELPIKNLVLVATALEGTEVADSVFDGSLLDTDGFLGRLIDGLSPFIDLRGLRQMTRRHVGEFLDRTRMPAQIHVFTAAGAQPRPDKLRDLTDARSLCPVCELGAKVIHGDSDGVVSLTSAYGDNVQLKSSNDRNIPIRRLKDIQADLDHFEQLLDYRYYIPTGIRNPKHVLEEQKRFYRAIISAVEHGSGR